MRFAIDCQQLEVPRWSGKERFLSSVLEQFGGIGADHQFLLFSTKPLDLPFDLPSNFTFLAKRLPPPLWQMWVLREARRRGAQALLETSAYLLPSLNYSIPMAVVIHDLTALLPLIKGTHRLSIQLREKITLPLAVRRASAVLTVSENSRRDLVSVLNIETRRVEVVSSAAHPSFRVIEDPDALNGVRRKYGLPMRFVLSVGTLEPRKNLGALLNAFASIRDQEGVGDVGLVMVGMEGWLDPGLDATARALIKEGRLIMTGFVPFEDIPLLYNAASCSVYPSLYEGFGLPVLESMACGCPLVSSNTSSIPEVAGYAALLVDPLNEDAMAAAIRRLLREPALASGLREKGIERARMFSWERTARLTMAALERVARGTSR